MSDTTTAEDRCRGVLVGLAAGDRIGGPIRMAVRLAESLARLRRLQPSRHPGAATWPGGVRERSTPAR